MLDELCQTLVSRQAQGWPVGNAVHFLERLPGFLASNALPEGYECLTAYSSLYIKETLDVHPCWQLPPVGNLGARSLAELWEDTGFEDARQRMRRLECRKCALVCHAAEFMDTLACLVNYEPYPAE